MLSKLDYRHVSVYILRIQVYDRSYSSSSWSSSRMIEPFMWEHARSSFDWWWCLLCSLPTAATGRVLAAPALAEFVRRPESRPGMKITPSPRDFQEPTQMHRTPQEARCFTGTTTPSRAKPIPGCPLQRKELFSGPAPTSPVSFALPHARTGIARWRSNLAEIHSTYVEWIFNRLYKQENNLYPFRQTRIAWSRIRSDSIHVQTELGSIHSP